VTFKPEGTGARTGALSIDGNASAGTSGYVQLTGTGAGPTATVAPTWLSFGSQTVGTTSAAQTVTLTNTGAVALAVSKISSSGDFAETNTCGSSVSAGASCTISVTFAPTAAGSRTGVLLIYDNAPDSTSRYVQLTGAGTEPPK